MQIRCLTFGADANPITRYNPVRPVVHWYNSRRMNDYVSKRRNTHFAKLQSIEDASHKHDRSIVDLVLTAYLTQNSKKRAQPPDSTFKKFTMNQVKRFLFSGHDTTSSTVCYMLYTLATKQEVLAGVRVEHGSVLGSETPQIASLVISDPVLLNRLPYTTAVIKETLRLYPVVSNTRAEEPDYHVTDELGRRYPTDSLLVWANPAPIHRDLAYWHQPDKFIPERWLVGPDDPLHPVKSAWRPFEHGPRNRSGQELAMIEMKVITIVTARRFELKIAYDELDGAQRTRGIKTMYGQRGYQIQRAQPTGDLPCRVSDATRLKATYLTIYMHVPALVFPSSGMNTITDWEIVFELSLQT